VSLRLRDLGLTLTLVARAGDLHAQAPPPPAPDLEAVLERAGRYVVTLGESLALVRAKEHYVQSLTTWRRGSSLDPAEERAIQTRERETRTLESEVLWIPTGDPIFLAFYRDVVSVNGKPVADRGERLARLFDAGVTSVAREEAGRILAESSRFNLGRRQRNTTSPMLALIFLHPANRSRCRFEAKGLSLVAGSTVLEVEFDETSRPTLIRTPAGRDQPMRGRCRLAIEDGAVLGTELWGVGTPARFEVRYERDPASGLVLPAEFREYYGRGTNEAIETVATYSGFQRGETEVGFKLVR